MNIIDFTPLSFGDYVLPGWAQFLGWCMALVSIVVIPIFAVYHIWASYKDPNYDGLSLPRVSVRVCACAFVYVRKKGWEEGRD